MSNTLISLSAAYAELPREQLAGMLVTTSISDRPVNANRLRDLMKANGLNDELVPNVRPEVFDFKTACRSVETRRGIAHEGKRQIVTVGEVVTNQAESVYQITAEVRDEANRVIEHQKGMRVVYDKGRAGDPVVGDDPIRFEPIDSENLYRSLHELSDRINLHFRAHRGMLPGAKVREIVRASLRAMHATRWSKGSSLWFVGMPAEDKLTALRTVITSINEDATFDIMPLPNTADMRDMLEGKIATHVREDATKLVAEIAEILGNEKITQRQFDRLTAARREVTEHAEQMQALLGQEVATVDEAMRLMDGQLMAMWERVGK